MYDECIYAIASAYYLWLLHHGQDVVVRSESNEFGWSNAYVMAHALYVELCGRRN
jgi:hypothetical protein